ncbi:helix-turn-helix domain-containing protein [Halomicrobium sp. LC1Hm]|uniref:helix-turn-helix domain-containing protein n=1 Tax=Halomicrobium sp. LC1Hm TaxID=2610902 RepID=UPI001298583E|nr:helix-turn-helix domain-containing protein [Halomicrobium sp. LC1Hm]QGA81785.1 Transcriptional regulator, contains HTH domain [Halomicrobium sp. LC1Hm]
MSEGLRVELAIDSPEACPVADVSERVDGSVTNVTRSTGGDAVVEEFSAPAGTEVGESVEPLFEDGSEARYRFRRDPDQDCFCDAVETFDCAVSDIQAEDGQVIATAHVDDAAQVRAVVEELRDAFGDVALRSLHQHGEGTLGDAVVVDRGQLTDRQREVLDTAHEMGYFDYPKGANAGEVAEALDISVSTLAEHLAAAQTKLLDDVLA